MMNKPFWLTVCILLTCIVACHGVSQVQSKPGDVEPSAEIVEEFDIPYPPPAGGDPALSQLDIYYKPDGAPKRLLVFIHGGSWIGGDKGNLRSTMDLVNWFVDRGFVVAAPNFRLASSEEPREVTYAEQVTDIAYALAWLDENGAAYGVTEPGMVLLGYSSGAHLVALLAADERYLQLAGLAHDDLAAAMSFDVHAYDVPYALQLMQGSELADNIPLIEFLFGATEAEQRVGSPSSYAPTADMPPTLLISADPSAVEGTKGYISYQTTERYANLLADLGHTVAWSHFDDETHHSLVADFGTAGDRPTAVVETFLEGLSLWPSGSQVYLPVVTTEKRP